MRNTIGSSCTSRVLIRCVALASASLLLLSSSAIGEERIVPDDVKGPFSWGAATRVTQLRHLHFADQPDSVGVEAARSAGVAVVINMRAPSESDWDEKAAVEKLGMAYYNVVVTGPTFDREQFEKIESLVATHPNDTILIHCGSSNRAGGWLATHLVTRHDLSEDEAIEVGRRAGITKRGVEERVHAYLATRETEGDAP